MGDLRIPWVRYWCEAGTERDLWSGFLWDPAEWPVPGRYRFDQLADKQCLILLGESGAGKSVLVEQLALGKLRHDLKGAKDPVRLRDRVFGGRAVRDWQAGGGVLELFLDSWDECALEVTDLAGVLIDFLDDHRDRLDRLRLRIACRTGHWSAELGSQLGELFAPAQTGAYELMALTQANAAELATASGVDAERFLLAVRDTGAEPLAARPVTLWMLVNLFGQQSALPSSRVELYDHGVRWMVEERSATRRAEDAADRLIRAERLAAVSLLCDRRDLWHPDADGLPRRSALTLADVEGAETVDGSAVRLGKSQLRDLLGTALFAHAGDGLRTWAHASYAEYLAARWLHRRGLDNTQVSSLLRTSAGHIVPQLRGLVAWLALSDPQLLSHLGQAEPTLYLDCDAGALLPAERADAVARLLAGLAARHFADQFSDHQYARLDHPGLPDQLRPFLTSSAGEPFARRAAFDMARACGQCVSLIDDLVVIALDEKDDPHYRHLAVECLASVVAESVTARDVLLRAARQELGKDDDDALRGTALRALWPAWISLADLLACLGSPSCPDSFGDYHRFLIEFRDGLPEGATAELLRWAVEQRPCMCWQHAYHEVVGAILIAALPKFGEPEVADLTSRTLAAWLTATEGLWDDYMATPVWSHVAHDEQVRRGVVQRVVASGEGAFRWLLLQPALVRLGSSDLTWLVDCARAARDHGADASELERWSRLGKQLCDGADAEQLSSLHALYSEYRPAFPALAALFSPVELGSQAAERLRQSFAACEAVRRQLSERRPPMGGGAKSFDRRAEIEQALVACEAGNHKRFIHVIRALAADENGRYRQHHWYAGQQEVGRWLAADDQVSRRTLSAACGYLLSMPCASPETYESDGERYGYEEVAAVVAIRLLAVHRLDALECLPAEVWRSWVPAVMVFPWGPFEWPMVDRSLVRGLFSQHHALCLEWLARVVSLWCRKQQFGRVEPLVRWVYDLLPSEALDELAVVIVGAGNGMAWYRLLLACDAAKATEFGLGPLCPTSAAAASLADTDRVEVAATLVAAMPESTWLRVRSLLDEQAFASAFLEELARRRAHLLHETWPDDAHTAVAVLTWVAQMQPPSADPEWGPGTHELTDVDHIVSLRRGLVARLEAAGEVDALQAVAQAVPGLDLRLEMASAEAQRRQRTWPPPSPKAVLQLAAGPGRRLLRDADDLLAVVLEAIDEYEVSLYASTPAWRDLWNIIGQDACPMDERECADHLQRALARTLANRLPVDALREPQVTQKQHCVDLLFSAAVTEQPPFEFARVAVEVKGCWHRDRRSALETQLVGDYLRAADLWHGIYLVLWFDRVGCQGSASESRRPPAKESKRSLQAHLDEQARSLSTGGRRVIARVVDASRILPSSR